jgi:hypothetical protein
VRFIIGHTEAAEQGCELDILVDTRLLIQANSGAGKSWCIRRILEQTFGQVQHLVIDPEGEFASLRERFDYVLAAKTGGDTAADPRSAKLLAHRLLELHASAILDVYELKAHERVRFVRLFLEALVDAPKALWHPVLVIVDEAHVYCPQRGEAESAGAVIDLATRGRKRGFCAVLATQRLSKLHKDAAAECNNKLIGRSALDVDMRRASEELGFVGREEQQTLRDLEPGEFYAFGPALSRAVSRVKVGSVLTTHPKAGARLAFKAPPPTEKVRGLLPQLADLPAEAEQQQRTLEAAQREIARLRRQITVARREQAPPDEAAVERRLTVALAGAGREHKVELQGLQRQQASLERILRDGVRVLTGLADRMAQALNGGPPAPETERPATLPRPLPLSPAERQRPPTREDLDTEGLKSGAIRILRELASRYPLALTRAQVGTLTGFTPSGGTFNTYIGELRRRGLIEVQGQEVRVTEDGLDAAGEVPAAPSTHDEVMALWQRNLKAGCYRMLQAVVDAGPQGITREELAELTEFTISGGTFNTYLSILRRNALIEIAGPEVRAADILWPEGIASHG